MEEGGWIVREYMNMLDVADMFSAIHSQQAINLIVRERQARCYFARGCLLTVLEKILVDSKKALAKRNCRL